MNKNYENSNEKIIDEYKRIKEKSITSKKRRKMNTRKNSKDSRKLRKRR